MELTLSFSGFNLFMILVGQVQAIPSLKLFTRISMIHQLCLLLSIEATTT